MSEPKTVWVVCHAPLGEAGGVVGVHATLLSAQADRDRIVSYCKQRGLSCDYVIEEYDLEGEEAAQ